MRYYRALKYITLIAIIITFIGCGSVTDTLDDGAVGLNAEDAGADMEDVETMGEPIEMTGDEFYDLITDLSEEQKVMTQKGLIDDILNIHIPYDWDLILDYVGDIIDRTKYLVRLEGITYYSKDAHGNKIKLSGLLIVPFKLSFNKPSLPIIAYSHGTELFRENSPSEVAKNITNISKAYETIPAILMALSGYIVAMPDYQGMGISQDMQPYCHKIKGRQVADMIKAAKQYTTKPWKFGRLFSPVSWNGKLFLIGYSEGGYVTMQTAKFLQKKRSDTFPVTGVASLAGPHDLSGTMRDRMISLEPYKEPFFLPFVVSSYASIYSVSEDPVVASLFDPDIVYNEPFNETLPPLMDGNTPSSEVNAAMGMETDPLQLIAPSEVLHPDYIEMLQDDSSDVVKILKKNDTYRGWIPQMPIIMIHHVNDELVPHENSIVAYEKVIKKGAADVELVLDETDVDVREDSSDTYHAYAAVPILFQGWEWIMENF